MKLPHDGAGAQPDMEVELETMEKGSSSGEQQQPEKSPSAHHLCSAVASIDDNMT
jgi:hypothetical protein